MQFPSKRGMRVVENQVELKKIMHVLTSLGSLVTLDLKADPRGNGTFQNHRKVDSMLRYNNSK